MDSRDTKADPHRVNAQSWVINGPYRAQKLDHFGDFVYKFCIIHFLDPFNNYYMNFLT